uniref:Uncharacterized protein n=1 Tax=Vitis vinifera TaxID=29760 RepID=A5BEZ0_VITVI|nr:hypothetical protein VITISV_013309 [Vitis vinifera]
MSSSLHADSPDGSQYDQCAAGDGRRWRRNVKLGPSLLKVPLKVQLILHLSDLGLLLYSGMYLILSPGLSLGFPNPRAIGCLLELHAPQKLLIIRVIVGGGLEIRLFTQVDSGILENSSKEAVVGEYSCCALNARDHMHHHQVSHVNPSPGEDRVHNKSLEVRNLISMSSMWQENRADHVVKDSAGHGQAVSRWFAHPLGIGESAQPLNNLSRIESRHNGPRLGLIHSESNRRDVENAADTLGTQFDLNSPSQWTIRVLQAHRSPKNKKPAPESGRLAQKSSLLAAIPSVRKALQTRSAEVGRN